MTGTTEREKYKMAQGWPSYLWVPIGCKFDQLFELGSNDQCLQKLGRKSLADYASSQREDVDCRFYWDHAFDIMDAYVFSMGNWAMSRPAEYGHWDAKRFHAYLEYCLETMHMINRKRQRHGMKDLRMIWQGMPAYTIELTSSHFDLREMRNPYRLRFWNDLVEYTMRTYGIEYVDVWTLSLP